MSEHDGWAAPNETAVQMPPPAYVPEEAPVAPRRRVRAIVAAATAVAVLAGGVVFAVTNLAASDGADSPEAAVRQFFDAISKRDMVGVLDALPPGERESIKEPVLELISQLKRLGVLATTLEPSDVPGFTVAFEGLTLQTTDIRPDLAVVEITGGTVKSTVDMAKLPFGSLIDELAFDGKRPTKTDSSTADMAQGSPRLATVKQGGGWHVSLWYSIAEAARRASGDPIPAVADAVPALGTATPETALKELVAAAINLDLRRIIELTPPDEARALHEYAPLFLDNAVKSAQQTKKDHELSISLDKLDTAVTGSGSTRQVAIKALAVSGKTVDGEFAASFDGDCVTFTSPGDAKPQKMCNSDAAQQLDQMGLSGLTGLATLDRTLGVTVVEVDGHWFVSPTRSLAELFLGVLRPLDQSKLRALIQSFQDIVSSSGTKFGPIGSAIDSSSSSASTSVAADPTQAVYDRCYSTDDPAACFADALAKGELTDADVPPEILFADCYGTFIGDRSTMSASELATAAAKVHDCLQPHIDAGEVNVDAVPAEVLKPECVGDVNPYSTSADSTASSDAFGKLYDCAYVG